MAQPSASCDVFAGSSFYADTVAKAQALAPERRPPEVTAFLQAHELLEQADAVLPPVPPPRLRQAMMAVAAGVWQQELVQNDGARMSSCWW